MASSFPGSALDPPPCRAERARRGAGGAAGGSATFPKGICSDLRKLILAAGPGSPMLHDP
eukprot:289473-Pyramimonas_sp.AAC.1